jgi:hypothetical protein
MCCRQDEILENSKSKLKMSCRYAMAVWTLVIHILEMILLDSGWSVCSEFCMEVFCLFTYSLKWSTSGWTTKIYSRVIFCTYEILIFYHILLRVFENRELSRIFGSVTLFFSRFQGPPKGWELGLEITIWLISEREFRECMNGIGRLCEWQNRVGSRSIEG